MLLPNDLLPELSPNRQAFPLVEEFLKKSEFLRIKVHKLYEVTIIDCGVHVQGGWEAGILFASICLGGLAKVKINGSNINGPRWPAVEVVTDHPIRACLASQYAGWPLNNGKKLAMGSGPGRAIVHEGNLFKTYGFKDCSEIAIFCLESEQLPTEEVVLKILKESQCDPSNLYILVAPTASLVGSIQIAARALETGISKLMELGYDLNKIVSGWGICPLPPVAGDNLSALGRTNDAILYGSTVLYYLNDEDEVLESIIKQVPSSSSREYGRSFLEVYKDFGDFYNLDPLFFSPAEVWFCNLNSGRTFHAGSLKLDFLSSLFGIEKD